jgi:hypothetical protein
MKTKTSLRTARILIIAVLSTTIFACGCVERKLTINTEPEEALIYLNDEEIGLSPVTIEFNWYGDYRIRIEKHGFETLNTHKALVAPAHDYFPLDFIAEVLIPNRIIDSYEWNFSLAPYQAPQREDLINAANDMRNKTIEELQQE